MYLKISGLWWKGRQSMNYKENDMSDERKCVCLRGAGSRWMVVLEEVLAVGHVVVFTGVWRGVCTLVV